MAKTPSGMKPCNQCNNGRKNTSCPESVSSHKNCSTCRGSGRVISTCDNCGGSGMVLA